MQKAANTKSYVSTMDGKGVTVKKSEFKKKVRKCWEIAPHWNSGRLTKEILDLLDQHEIAPPEGWEPETYEITQEGLTEVLNDFSVNNKSLLEMFGNEIIDSIIARSTRS